MEPDLVAYSPIMHRPHLRWPGGARVALWVVPNIEHYEFMPKFVRTRIPGRARRTRTCWAIPNVTTATASGCGGCSG